MFSKTAIRTTPPPPGQIPSWKLGRRRINGCFFLLFLFCCYFQVIIFINGSLFKRNPYFRLFSHCKRDFLDQQIVFNCFSVLWVIICIHISSSFDFQYNNWKSKAGTFEYLRINLGVFVLEPSKQEPHRPHT